MNIPKEVIIGGLRYEVIRACDPGLGYQFEGVINAREQTITICDVGTDYAKITFLHECIHGMLEAIGIPPKDHKERIVDGLAHQLFQLIKDNPKMFNTDNKEQSN